MEGWFTSSSKRIFLFLKSRKRELKTKLMKDFYYYYESMKRKLLKPI